MGYIKRKARNAPEGFHSKRHARRAAAGEVHKVLTKVADFGLTLVTIKRRAAAYRMIARENFPNGLPERERRPGVLSVPGARSTRKLVKLRPQFSARMAEVG